MQDTGPPGAKTRRTSRLHPDKRDAVVVEEAVEDADRVGAAADTGDDGVWQPSLARQHLLASFASDDRLQFAHDLRVPRGADARANEVVRRLDIRDPVAYCFARRLLQRPRSEIDPPHLRSEQTHSLDVRALAPHVFLTHVDDAVETEAGDRKSTRLNSSHGSISYAVFCLKK